MTRLSFFKSVLGGVDFGSVSPTALIANGVDGGGRAWAFAEFYRHECAFDLLVEAMAEMGEKHGIKRWIADPSGKKEIEKLRNAGFRVSPARHGNRINLRYQILSARLNVGADKLPGAYITPECPNLIMEIEGLSWTRRKAGLGKDGLTGNWDPPDHAVDAWTNCLADIDAVQPPFNRPREPVQLYEGVAR